MNKGAAERKAMQEIRRGAETQVAREAIVAELIASRGAILSAMRVAQQEWPPTTMPPGVSRILVELVHVLDVIDRLEAVS